MAIVFLYQCPTLGLRVQGWAEDAGADDGGESYEAVAHRLWPHAPGEPEDRAHACGPRGRATTGIHATLITAF